MYFIAVLVLLLLVVFLIFVGRQSASTQRSRKSRREIWQDDGSDLSILSIALPQVIPHTSPDSFPEARSDDASPDSFPEVRSHDASVDNYATDHEVASCVSVSSVDYGSSSDSMGGGLGSALADAIDSGGSSFGGFDGGSDFGGDSTTDGSSS
jgi:hypothetical protein